MPITRIEPTQLPAQKEVARTTSAQTKAGSFTKVIDELLGQVNAQQAQADQAVRDLAVGKTDNIHNVMLQVAKADLAFRLVLQIRNRLTEGFQEVLRLQV